MYITEPKKQIPIAYQADLLVVGGGCTGVFAAVRAARLGLNVALVEKQNALGGVAGNGLVNIWHSLYDVDFHEQIIAGLTAETVEHLKKTDSVILTDSESTAIRFDPNMLKHILDGYIQENKIKLFLHTHYDGLLTDGNRVTAVLLCNKDGRSAITADFFIDATGDGDLMRDLNVEYFQSHQMQPPSSCFFMTGDAGNDLSELIEKHGQEFGLEDDWGWNGTVPGLKDITFRADFHVFNVDCSRAEDLTYAEIEGRRKAFAFTSMLKKYGGKNSNIAALCSQIGIRETKHYRTRYQAKEMELLTGKRYEDAVLNGTYRVDIHHNHDNGITFKYLDGRQETIYGKSEKKVQGNWRQALGLDSCYAKFYQVPFSILVPNQIENLLPAGRMLNADDGAFGALRVMVNLNQLGEAAGTAAYLALHTQKSVQALSGVQIRNLLRENGSAL